MFVQGQLYRRRALHEHLGGQRQGGISTPAGVPIILLFTGEGGEEYGYSDGWAEDGIFHYTGEGQIGDMTFVRGILLFEHTSTAARICTCSSRFARAMCAISGKWSARVGASKSGLIATATRAKLSYSS
jgi:hypothetical protein